METLDSQVEAAQASGGEDPEDVQARTELLKFLLANQIINQSTDIHVSEKGRVLYRCCGNMLQANSWEKFTDDQGKLIAPYHFDRLKKLLLRSTGRVGGVTRVHRGTTTQVRVQGLHTTDGDKLFIRIQPKEPPKLVTTLGHTGYSGPNGLLKALTNASGLVLVCGSIGSGKTTLAASIVDHWASQRARHIATIEDPVEYLIKPGAAGEVSSVDASFLRGAESKGPSFDEVVRDLLRSDCDGLFIGEARDAATRNACIDFAATEEPVVTTVHAGGFADAVLRLTHTDGGRDSDSLRQALAQSLHTLIYVKLAYSEKGKQPVPVICALPGSLTAVRTAIADGNPKTMATQLQAALKDADANGGASGGTAVASAAARGANAKAAQEALPHEARVS